MSNIQDNSSVDDSNSRQKPISIKIPDLTLILIDNFVRLERYESRSHFLRIAIEEMLKQELGTWEKLVNQISD